MIRSIIIDDEEKAREGLRIILEKYCPDIEIVASCEKPEVGLKKIEELKPELVFLDVQMPRMSGFDLLDKIGEINFEVIFITSYDKYAIKAIKFSALDYLLKPIDIDDLVSAVERIKEKQTKEAVNFKSLLSNMKNRSEKLTRLAIPTENEIVMQDLKDIIYCEADGSYSNIHLVNDKKITVSKMLKDFENILPENDFCRIHHGSLINMAHVVKYVRGEGGYVVMTGGGHLDVSRRKKDGFIQMLNKL